MTKSDLPEVTYVSRLLRLKLSKGEESYQPNLDHSYKIRENFWSYCKNISESEPSVQPSFDRSTCFSYFEDSLKCKNKTRNFELPSWIVSMEPPSVEFDLSPTQYLEVAKAVTRMKSYQYTSVQNCPNLRTYLHRIIDKCWLEHSIPRVWKNGFTILIYKKGETSDPSDFRPITLEPVCMKILSSIIRRRLSNFLIKNSYVESDI